MAKYIFELKDLFACLPFPTTRYINSSEILTSSPALNIYVTVLLWVYMFVVQIGMLNLLIAIMTDTYFKVILRPACPPFPPAAKRRRSHRLPHRRRSAHPLCSPYPLRVARRWRMARRSRRGACRASLLTTNLSTRRRYPSPSTYHCSLLTSCRSLRAASARRCSGAATAAAPWVRSSQKSRPQRDDAHRSIRKRCCRGGGMGRLWRKTG